MEEGVFSENARPVYQSGGQANSKYVTGAFAEYDLSKGNFRLQPSALFRLKVLFVKSFGFIKTKRMIYQF